jgi:hypothetical protein
MIRVRNESSRKKLVNKWLCVVTSLFISSPLIAQDFGGEPDPKVFEKPSYSPYAGRQPEPRGPVEMDGKL